MARPTARRAISSPGCCRLAAAKKPRGVFRRCRSWRGRRRTPAPTRPLRAVLAEWPAEAPTLIRVAAFRRGAAARERTASPALAPLPFAFDDAVAGRANIRQAASLGLVDSDSVLRRWRLSQTVCDGDRGVTFPSPQLVAASLDADRPAADLDAFLAWRARRVCARDGAPAPVWPRNAANETNIAFLFSGEAGAPVPAVAAAGRETPVFRRIPAHSLVDARREALRPGAVADDLFAGRLVVIGATHMDAADLHLTPIGRLPGAVIASNAIVSAPAVLNSFGLAPWGRTLMAFVVFAGLAAMSFRFRAMAAGVIVSLACLALAPLLGRVLAPAPALEIIFAALAMLAMFAGLESLIEVATGVALGAGLAGVAQEIPQGDGMTRFLAALVALFTLAAAPAAAQQRPAGFVTGLDLPEGAPAPVLRRQGEALDVQVWRELFDGDALEISGKASVTIETAKDKRLVVDAARSPHRIEGELGGGGKFATFAATLGELFKSKPEKTPANLVGRSNDAAPRLLPGRSDEPQIVVPGQPIWVGWQGGTAPFTVELRGQTPQAQARPSALASVTNGVDNEAKLDRAGEPRRDV
jgi:hypothetical protein